MRRVPLTLIPALLTSLALAGCGGTDGSDRATAPGKAEAPARVSLGVVTDGRTGDAVTGTDAGSIRRLSRGGRPDTSAPRPGRSRVDGVAAGDACTDQEIGPDAGNLGRVASVTLCLLNGQRADHGLPALRLNDRLAQAAAGHADAMVARSFFAHEGQDGSTVKTRIDAAGYIPSRGRWVIGENLAWGTGPLATPKSIVNAWMNSPGHRANVLHADYREIGFGIVAGNPRIANGAGATYATAFGAVGEPDAGTLGATEEGDEAPAARRARARRAAEKRAAEKRSSRAKRAAKARRARASRARASRARSSRARKARTARARRALARRASARRTP